MERNGGVESGSAGANVVVADPDNVGYYSHTVYSATFGAAAAAGVVPEPATWGMMIVGFGVIGSCVVAESSLNASPTPDLVQS